MMLQKRRGPYWCWIEKHRSILFNFRPAWSLPLLILYLSLFFKSHVPLALHCRAQCAGPVPCNAVSMQCFTTLMGSRSPFHMDSNLGVTAVTSRDIRRAGSVLTSCLQLFGFRLPSSCSTSLWCLICECQYYTSLWGAALASSVAYSPVFRPGFTIKSCGLVPNAIHLCSWCTTSFFERLVTNIRNGMLVRT